MSDAPADRPEHVLLVRLSALGDIVQCLEALAAVRAARPGAVIGWLIEDRFADLLDGHPHIDRLFVFRRKDVRAGRTSWPRLLRDLRSELRAFAPDVAVDLQGNLKGALLTRLSGARRRIGLPRGEAREGAHVLATERVPPGPDAEPRADRALRLVRPLGAAAAEARLAPVPAEARRSIDERLDAGRPFALLVPGTSAFGAFKRWPPERFGALAARLRAERGLDVLVSAGPGEDELADAVVGASEGAARRAPRTASLAELIHLLGRAALVVGADSGPVGLAAAAGTPTVALFGPKDPRIYAPRGPCTAVVWKGVYCSPCSLRRCGEPICMTTLSVERVWIGVEAVLSDPAGALPA